MRLSGTLFEQISGVGLLECGRDPNLITEWEMSLPRKMEAILPLMERLEAELEAL